MEVCWPKVLGQGDEKSQNVWGRGVRWALPLRGTPGTLQKQALVGVKVHTRAFADPWTVVTCPPRGPRETTLPRDMRHLLGLGSEAHPFSPLRLRSLRTSQPGWDLGPGQAFRRSRLGWGVGQGRQLGLRTPRNKGGFLAVSQLRSAWGSTGSGAGILSPSLLVPTTPLTVVPAGRPSSQAGIGAGRAPWALGPRAATKWLCDSGSHCISVSAPNGEELFLPRPLAAWGVGGGGHV